MLACFLTPGLPCPVHRGAQPSCRLLCSLISLQSIPLLLLSLASVSITCNQEAGQMQEELDAQLKLIDVRFCACSEWQALGWGPPCSSDA